jgi:hypothetical protein
MARHTVVGNLLRNVELTADDWPKVSNVIALFDAGTQAERDEGETWYLVANEHAKSMARLAPDLTVRRAAGIIAALSPQNSWTHNLNMAIRTAKFGECPPSTIQRNCDKANAIMGGAEPEDVLGNGPKTLAFWQNIYNPATSNAVTIDRHAVHAAYGEVLDERRRGWALRQRKDFDGYELVANVYRQAAREINVRDGRDLAPHQVQAVVWVVWRNLNSTGGRT